MSAPVIVTGGTGWLGGRLVRALTEGLADPRARWPGTAELRCLVEPGHTTDAPGADSVTGDLRDTTSLRALFRGAAGGTLFHCAGCIHPRRFTRELFEVNVHGTRNLLEAARAAGIRRAVVVSSSAALGTGRTRDEVFDEGSPYRPGSKYGLSKQRMEEAVSEFQARGALETVVVRAPWFYGPDQPPRQTLFFSMIRRGRAPIVGDGENLRSMVYLDDLCRGLLLCALRPEAAGETYCIADRRPYTMNEIVDTVESLLEHEFGLAVAHRRLRLPAWTGALAQAASASVQALGLYGQKLQVLSEMNRTIVCSIEKARRELGYEPGVGLEEGMRRSIRSCLERGLEI